MTTAIKSVLEDKFRARRQITFFFLSSVDDKKKCEDQQFLDVFLGGCDRKKFNICGVRN